MARKNASPAPEPETTEETEVTATEAEATPVEDAVKEPVDLTAFYEAANELADTADETNGQPTDEAIEKMNAAFRALPAGKEGRLAGKEWLFEQVKIALDAADIPRARSFTAAHENVSAAKGGGSAKEPVNPTQAFVEKVASLFIATELAQDSFLPENLDEGWQEKLTELTEAESTSEAVQAWKEYSELEGDEKAEATEPDVPGFVKAAFKMASTKVVRRGGGGGRPANVYDGPKRSIRKHIDEAFADKESGAFLKVGEIAKFKSEEYGDDNPSSGAVNAHLFPSREGAEPRVTDDWKAAEDSDGHKGAVKL